MTISAACQTIPCNPFGSGTDVWLQEQIIERIGREQAQSLINEARTHKAQRYKWLCAEMSQRGHSDLATEYHARKKSDEAAIRLRDKKRLLAEYQRQLDATTDAHLRELRIKRIRKVQKYIDEREK